MKYNWAFVKRYLNNKYEHWSYKLLYDRWLRDSLKSKVHGLVLMYHNVTDEYVDTLNSCKCAIEKFRSTLVKLKSQGYIFVSVDGALALMKSHSTQKFAVVTFDDVPSNVYYNAYPVLKSLEIPFTFFITTDFIDKEGFISKEQLMEVDKDPLCTIGAHTLSHPHLRKSNNSYSELKESKRILESLLNHSVDYLAYPYGRPVDVSRKNQREAEKIGYKCAFGTILTPISDESINHLFYLPRVVIN